MSTESRDRFAPHVRWNIGVMGLDIALFVGGINFSAWTTILPLFVRHLTGSNLLLGMIPAVRSLGGNIPPVLVSSYVERLRHFKAFVLWGTIMERVPYLLLAIATLILGTGHPTLLLVIFFLTLATTYIAAGITTPAWLHLVSLMIPIRLRGRFFGLSSGAGGLVGVGAAGLTAVILRQNPYPRNFAICFLCTFVFLVVSYVALALGHEPVEEVLAERQQRVPLYRYLRSLPAVLRREPNFSLFLLASVLGNTGIAVSPFLTAAASRTLHVPDSQISLYGVVLLLVSTVGSVGWGWLGDHAGYRLVLAAGNAMGVACVAAALVGLGAQLPGMFYVAFAFLGAYSSAIQLAAFAAVIEFAAPAERPTFIALGSVVQVPAALATPLAAGIIADRLGYAAIFWVAAAILAAASVLFIFAVRDPRAVGTGEPAIA